MIVTEQDVGRFWSKVDRSGGSDACWPWTAGSVVKGYGTFWLASEQGKVLAHRVAYVIEHGEMPDHGEGQHHGIAGTQLDNVSDAVLKGRHIRGETQGSSKLTEGLVREIRERYAAGGITQAALGAEYDINQGQVSKILSGRRWRHIG